MNKKIKVFYDGKCSVCKKEIDFYSKIDKEKSFDWDLFFCSAARAIGDSEKKIFRKKIRQGDS